MNLFELFGADHLGRDFATAYISETIPWENPDEVCKLCPEPCQRRRVDAYTITWQSGSDVVPDLLCPGDDFIVTDRVKLAFEEAGLTGYTPWPVKIKGKPNRGKRRRWPIVGIPYEGPPLWDIYVPEFVSVIPGKSTLESTGICEACGKQGYETVGDADELFFVVDRSTWNGSDFMRPREMPGVFVTERVIRVIEKGAFTNVDILRRARMSD